MNAQFDPVRETANERIDPLTGAVVSRPSFASEVSGKAPKQIDFDLALIARDVYDSHDRTRPGVEEWKPLTEEQLRKVGIDPASLSNKSSGFDADIYTDGKGRYVLAYRGSDGGNDWTTNFGQGLGFETAQYNQAMALAKQAKVAFGDELVITGHSLGGGLASVGALVTDTPAVTFNAAGVKDATLERVGLDAEAVKREAADGQIRRYAVDNDILTDLQEKKFATRYLMPDAVGFKIELPDPDPQSFWQRINPVQAIKHGVNNHTINQVIEAMDIGLPGLRPNAPTSMSEPGHPLNADYAKVLGQVQAAERERGGNSSINAENLAGALVLEMQRVGLTAEKLDKVTFSGDGERAFAVLGKHPESQNSIYVDTKAASQTPVEMASQQAAKYEGQCSLPPSGQQPALEPAQELGNLSRGAR